MLQLDTDYRKQALKAQLAAERRAAVAEAMNARLRLMLADQADLMADVFSLLTRHSCGGYGGRNSDIVLALKRFVPTRRPYEQRLARYMRSITLPRLHELIAEMSKYQQEKAG